VFSQALTEKSGLCASPLFGMMLQFLSLVRDQQVQVAVVAPRWGESVPRGMWWPLWVEFATDRVLSATRGTMEVFVEQTMHGEWEPAKPVPCDVWGICFRCAWYPLLWRTPFPTYAFGATRGTGPEPLSYVRVNQMIGFVLHSQMNADQRGKVPCLSGRSKFRCDYP
jgi:hypothetical protein